MTDVAVFAFLASVLPFTSDKDWSLVSNYWLLFFIGAVSFATFALHRLLRLDSTSAKMLQTSVLIMLLGAVALTDFRNEGDLPTWQLWAASGLFTVGFCLGTVQLPSMFARMTTSVSFALIFRGGTLLL